MSIKNAAEMIRQQGRGNDSMLMHVTPSEVQSLQGIAQAHGGSLSINPQTGLPEAGFLENILPTIAGIGVGFATANPMLGAAVAGGLGYATSGSLEKGLLAGLGAFGGASAFTSLAGVGATGAGLTGATGAAGAGTGIAGAAANTSIGAGGSLLGGYGTTVAAPAATLGGTAATGLGPTLQAAQAGSLATAAAPGTQALTAAQQFSALPMGQKFSALGSGFSNLVSDPSATFSTMGGLKGQGANLAMAAAPLLGMDSTDTTANPELQDSYIRPAVYDPQTQQYTRLAPVDSSDWGNRSFAQYAQDQGYQDGGVVQQRYQQPIRTVDPTVTDYNQMLMNQAQQEYVQGISTPPSPIPPAMQRAAPTGIAAAPSINTTSARLYDPATQRYTDNPDYVDPKAKPQSDLLARDRYDRDNFGNHPDYSIGMEYGQAAAGGYIKKLAAGGITDIPKFQAGGDMQSDAFVIPADVVSALGNGSTRAGLERLNQYLGIALPIEGEGDGLSDDIPATIEGEQPARVADGEAYIPPEVVAQLGGGDPERGAAMLYTMMDKIRESAHGKSDQQSEVAPDEVMPV